MDRFRRIMRLMAALAIVLAGFAVILVIRGKEHNVQWIVAAALGVGATVMLLGTVTTWVFVRSTNRGDNRKENE